MSFNEYSVYFDHLKSLAAAFVGISDAKTVHGLFFEAERGDLSAWISSSPIMALAEDIGERSTFRTGTPVPSLAALSHVGEIRETGYTPPFRLTVDIRDFACS